MAQTLLEEMEQIVQKLNEAADAYYNGQSEKMTDYEWDALFDKLKKMEEETGVVLDGSPTSKVSSDSVPGEKEAHEYSALSLAKTKKIEDLVKWSEGKEVWISWKLDGLTLVVTYDNGKLSKVVTRGDGHIGTNITHLSKAIEGIPQSIEYKGHLVLRGEALISYADFERFVMESGEDYANPRNLASGSLTLKNLEELKKRKLNWIVFTLVHCDETYTSWGEQMDFLAGLGFQIVEHEKVEHPDLMHLQKVIDQWTKKVTDNVNPYPVDGLVLDYEDVIYAQGGSVTGHHATRSGYAFKWADESADTTLESVEWSCAASTITPVAIFIPVELEGTVVKRASLCNISECERLGIGEEGTQISVIKANKIIPKVIAVKKTEGVLHIPDICPVCGTKTEIHISEVSGTKTLRCTNPDCDAKKLRKYARFVSKGGVDMDGISEMTLSRFINEGWIHTYGDIYRLLDHLEEIAGLDGFGEKSASNMEASILKAVNVPDTKLLFALNIPLVGVDVAKKLLAQYPLEELISIARETEDETVFSSIDGIGPEKSRAFIQWIKDEKNYNALSDVLSLVHVVRSVQEASGSLCEGKTFVITGDVHHYKNRNELKAYIESQKGKVTGSVSKSTDYLINNDITSTSSKNKKARDLNIPIISEEQFIEQFVSH